MSHNATLKQILKEQAKEINHTFLREKVWSWSESEPKLHCNWYCKTMIQNTEAIPHRNGWQETKLRNYSDLVQVLTWILYKGDVAGPVQDLGCQSVKAFLQRKNKPRFLKEIWKTHITLLVVLSCRDCCISSSGNDAW